MKKIGLRTVKTAIAIFICLLIYILLKSIELIPGVKQDFAYNWYNPFFAAIATAYSIHASRNASFKQAKNRCVASLIGGIIGILLITIYELFGFKWVNLTSIDLKTFNFIVPYCLISLVSIVVVVVGLMLNQPQAVFVSILTFLSVTVNPNINVDYWQWQFGLNRILSTIVGVLVALGVNLFRLPHKYYNKNLLFCVGIDGMLNESDTIKGFMQFKMNYLYFRGANVTLFTTRTPATFMSLITDVKISHPIICMAGAALYDAQNKHYLAIENMDDDILNKTLEVLKEYKVSPFINTIKDDVLFTYNEEIANEGAKIYFDSKKNDAYSVMIHDKAPTTNVLYLLIIEEENKIDMIINAINSNKILKDNLKIIIYDSDLKNNTMKYIKIYSSKIENLSLLKKYCYVNNLDIVGLTSSKYSNHLLKNSLISITLANVESEVKNNCNKIIKSSSVNDLFKEINKIYHANLSKYEKK